LFAEKALLFPIPLPSKGGAREQSERGGVNASAALARYFKSGFY
jgi:hypothetical protein